jgi:hypothetical protein
LAAWEAAARRRRFLSDLGGSSCANRRPAASHPGVYSASERVKAGGLTIVVKIAISPEAFAAICATLPFGSVSYENARRRAWAKADLVVAPVA